MGDAIGAFSDLQVVHAITERREKLKAAKGATGKRKLQDEIDALLEQIQDKDLKALSKN